MAEVTKTYQYQIGASVFSVDVTVDIPLACIHQPVGPGEIRGNKTITAYLSDPVPFPLHILLKVTRRRNDQYGFHQSIYDIIVSVPTDETYFMVEKECYHYQIEEGRGFFSDETWDYEFIDQEVIQVGAGPLESVVASKVNLSCFGIPTGSIVLNTIGGLAPYTYLWSDNASINSPERNNLPAGTYSVTVTDSAENEVVISGITITQPAQITLAVSVTPVKCFGGSNGAVNITPSGGVAPYTYAWSDGSSARNRTGMSSGNYSVIVRDANGCSRTFPIVVSQPAQLSITVNQEGKNVVNTISGGTAPYTYLWSDGLAVKDRSNLANGTYSFTVTDANGCQQSTMIVIQDFKFYFSKNPIWLQLQASSLGTKPNLSFVCEVLLEEQYGSENFVKKYESEQPARADGSTDFNMEQVLNAFLDSQVPEFGDTAAGMARESFKRFYLRYYEKYGNPPVPAPSTQVETFYVLFGGLSEQEFAKQVYFESYLDLQKPFLTWQPLAVPVTADQHAYLRFVANNPEAVTLVLRATIHYDDGTSATFNAKTVNGAQPFEVYQFPAGPSQLLLANINPSKQIRSYDLQLYAGNAAASEKRSFEVFPARKHYKKLLFLNSVGGWDSVLCFGRGKKSLRTDEETITRDLPVGYRYSDRETETVSKTGTLTGEFVIGNINGYDRRHLTDLAISEKVYEQTASGYLPVRVKFDFDPEDDFENLDEISLDIIYPTIRRYTPEL